MQDQFDYMLFGLRIRSEIELPELPHVDGSGEPDIIVRRHQSTPVRAAAKGSEVLIEGVARYEVHQGREILIEPVEGVSARNVRLYLLGSALGLLLHQRGDLPLHANAVEVNRKAFAFMGPSGAGKSTLAGAFHDRGYRVIADDVCVIRFNGKGLPLAFPGVPRLRLWETALEASGRSTADFELSYAGDELFRKFDVPVGMDRAQDPVPLAAIFLLEEAEAPALARLHGVSAVEAIYANTYRGAYVAREGSSLCHWKSSLALVRTTPVLRFCRPIAFEAINDQLDYLLGAFTRLEAET